MKIKLCLLYLLTAILISGCGSSKSNEMVKEISVQNPSNEFISIYNHNDELIKQFYVFGSVHLTNDSLIYSKASNESMDKIVSIDYYRYYFETGETVELGSIAGWDYESRYNTAIVGDGLYFFAATAEKKEYFLGLYCINLDKNELTNLYKEKGISQYNAMAVVGEKLLITKLLDEGGCELEEYNTKTHERKIVRSFEFDNQISSGRVIRQLTADENTISFLMLQTETENKVSLYMDVYDYDMNFLRTVGMEDISGDNNELRQPVSAFYAAGDYVYYENFSTTRSLDKITEEGITPVMALNGNYNMAAELVKSKKDWVLYEAFTNDIYRIDSESGSISRAEYYADNEKYRIAYMLRAENDNVLISMQYHDPNSSEKLPAKIYYFNLNDLDFHGSEELP